MAEVTEEADSEIWARSQEGRSGRGVKIGVGGVGRGHRVQEW